MRPCAPRPAVVKIEARRPAQVLEDHARFLRRQKRQRGRVVPIRDLVAVEERRLAAETGIVTLETRVRPAQGDRRALRPPPREGDETDRVPVLGLVEDPTPGIEKRRHIDILRPREDLLPELGRALGGQRRARQHDADPSAVLADEVPEAPAEGLVQVGIAGAHAGVRAARQRAAQRLGRGQLAFVDRDKIGPLAAQPLLGRLLLALGERAQTRRVTRPECVFLQRRLLPRRIPHDHVEPRPLAQKHLGESDREVKGVKTLEPPSRPLMLGRTVKPLADLLPARQIKLDPLCPFKPRRRHEVAEGLGRSGGSAGLLHGAPRAAEIGRGRICDPRQALQRPGRAAEQVGRVEVEEGMHPLADLLQPPDPDERIATHEDAVEERKREPRHEGMDPDREARKLHGDRVEIDAVDAAPRDQPPQKLRVLDLRLVGERSEGRKRRRAQGGELGRDGRQPPPREMPRQRALDPVDRRDEKMPRAHREIGDAKIEAARPGRLLVQGVEPREVLGERRLERAL